MIRNHGFTMVELLVSTALGMLVIAITWSAFNGLRKVVGREKTLALRSEEAAGVYRMLAEDLHGMHRGCLLRAAVVPDAGRPRWLDLTWMRSVQINKAAIDRNTGQIYRHDLTWVRWRWDARLGVLQRSTTGACWWEDPLADRSNPFDTRTIIQAGNSSVLGPGNTINGAPGSGAAVRNTPFPRRAGWEQITCSIPGSTTLGYFVDRPQHSSDPAYLKAAKNATTTNGWFERDLADNDFRWVPGTQRPGLGYPWCSQDDTRAASWYCDWSLAPAPNPTPDITLRVAGDEVQLQRNLAMVLDGVAGFDVAWSDLGGWTYNAGLDWNERTLAGSALDTLVITPRGGSATRRNRLTISGAYTDGTAIDTSENAARTACATLPSEVQPLPSGGEMVNLRRPSTVRVRLRLSSLGGDARLRLLTTNGSIPDAAEILTTYSFSFPVCGTLETP